MTLVSFCPGVGVGHQTGGVGVAALHLLRGDGLPQSPRATAAAASEPGGGHPRCPPAPRPSVRRTSVRPATSPSHRRRMPRRPVSPNRELPTGCDAGDRVHRGRAGRRTERVGGQHRRIAEAQGGARRRPRRGAGRDRHRDGGRERRGAGADDGVDDEQAVSAEPTAAAARSAPDTRMVIEPRARRGRIRARGRRMRDRGARDDGDVLTCVR